MRHFLQYWTSYDHSTMSGQPLHFSASQQLARISPGDVLWIVVLDEAARLHLLGRILARQIVGRKKAVSLLGPNIFDAPLYAISSPKTAMKHHVYADIQKLAPRLRFESGRDRLTFKTQGRTDGRQLQSLRQLTPDSVRLLEGVLSRFRSEHPQGRTRGSVLTGHPRRNYWVVSPNVKNNNKTIDQWIAAMKAEKVAFMGYAPSDVAHKRIGAKFAYEIKADDVVLIARRYRKAPDLVACGVVSGGYKRVRKSFHAPTTYGSHRELSPFVPLKKAPRSVPIMEVLRHTAALRQLNSAKATHRRVCRWLDRQLSIASNLQNSNGSTKRSTNAVEASLPQHQQLEYQIRTRRQVKSAQKREAELVKDYAAWLHKKGRVIAAFKNGYLTCDLYEKAGCNLIEAKARGEREYIRMAVGQLLDYSYLGRKILRRPNLAILLPDKPPDHAVAWLRPLRIGIIWKVGNRFRDNAGGRFT